MHITVIQVPWDSGHYGKRMGKGPLRLIESGLADHLKTYNSGVEVIECNPERKFMTEAGAAKALNTVLSNTVRETRRAGRFPVVLAGNCNTALGITASLNTSRPGVVWLDAHADFNTPNTTASGFFDAMGLSILTGNSWKRWRTGIPGFSPVEERNVVLIGAWDIDPEERKLLENSDINRLSVQELRGGPDDALSVPLQRLAARCEEAYVHVDLDVFDPGELKANEFQAGNGLLLSEVKGILSEAGARSAGIPDTGSWRWRGYL